MSINTLKYTNIHIYICAHVYISHIYTSIDILLRIKLKCGLVSELTLRVNIHSNGQESPLSHHYVFYHLVWVIESYSMTHNLWASSFPMLMCLVLNEERGWLYKAPSSHLVCSWVFLLCEYTFLSLAYSLCLYSLPLSLSHTHTHTHTHSLSSATQNLPRFFT